MAIPKKYGSANLDVVAGQLSAVARRLDRAVEAQNEVLNRLLQIGEQEAAHAEQQRQAAVAEQVASLQPLIERGRDLLEAAEAADREVRPLVDKFYGLDWQAVRSSFAAHHGVVAGSEHSTATRLGLLQRTVEEAREILRGNQSELKEWISKVDALAETASHDAKYAINGLTGAIRSGDRGTALLGKAGAIRRLLAEIGEQILPVEETK
jgi:hypothetical protein